MNPTEDQPAQSPESLPTAPVLPPPAEIQGMSKNEQTMGMLCHLTALAKYLIPGVGHIVGPLVVWMLKRQEMPFVDSQGKESLNFQITMTICLFIAGILCLVLIGIPIFIGLLITDTVLVIMASLETANGKPYRYPLCIRFIK